VRAAVDQGIDRRAIVERVFPRGAVEPARSLVPPEVFGYGGEPGARPTAPEAATPIAAPRGAIASPLFLDYSNRYPPFVDFLVQALDGAGLQVEPRSLPYEDLYHRIETGGSRIYVFSWHFLVADALPFLNALIHSRDPLTGMGRFNGADFSDPGVDAEIVAAAREPLSEVRLEHLRQALARTSEAHVYLPLVRRQALALLRNSLNIEPVPGPLAAPQDVHLVK
jgi:ABC-type transport system substrate-binding protein